MKIFEKSELKLLWPFYLEAVLTVLFFFTGAFYIVYFKNIGLSMFQIGLLSSALAATALIFEIPTGAIADLYGRKVSVLIGYFISGLSLLSVYLTNSFQGLLFAFALAGLGSTFVSGAKVAWVTDLVKGKEKILKNYFVKVSSLSSFSAIFSGIIGAWVVKNFGIRITWLIGGATFFLSVLILLFAKEKFVRKKPHVKKSFNETKNQIKVSIKYIKNNNALFYLILAMLIANLALGFISSFPWTVFLQQKGMPDYAFGYLMSAMGVIGTIAPLIASKLHKAGKEKKFIIITIAISFIISLLIFISFNYVIGLIVLLSAFLFMMMRGPIESMYFQRFVPSKLRATIGSVDSMLLAAVAIIADPLLGFSVDNLGSQITILIGVIIAIPAIILYLKIKEPKNKKH